MVCNPSGFGPPRACSARFALPMGSSPGFGSVRRDSSPFRTRVRSGSGCPRLSLAAPNHSLAHSTKGTPSQDQVLLRPARSARFQALFHSPRRGAFHRSLTVLVPYRSLTVFSLGWWSTQLPTRFRVSGSTHGSTSHARPKRRLRDSHPLRSPVPEAFGCSVVKCEWSVTHSMSIAFNPGTTAPTGSYAAPVWAPPRSLAATEGILSVPLGTEMFQFPRCPPLAR
jgi:hypothetical protein